MCADLVSSLLFSQSGPAPRLSSLDVRALTPLLSSNYSPSVQYTKEMKSDSLLQNIQMNH